MNIEYPKKVAEILTKVKSNDFMAYAVLEACTNLYLKAEIENTVDTQSPTSNELLWKLFGVLDALQVLSYISTDDALTFQHEIIWMNITKED